MSKGKNIYMSLEGVSEAGWGENDFKKLNWATLVTFRIIFKQFMVPVKTAFSQYIN